MRLRLCPCPNDHKAHSWTTGNVDLWDQQLPEQVEQHKQQLLKNALGVFPGRIEELARDSSSYEASEVPPPRVAHFGDNTPADALLVECR